MRGYHEHSCLIMVSSCVIASADISSNNYSRTSATNNAELYNSTSRPEEITKEFPANLNLRHQLSTEYAWEAFFTYALLCEHEEAGSTLELAHNAPSHMERLRPALQARNQQMAGPGQEEWSHACNLCCWVNEDEDGQISENFPCIPNDPLLMLISSCTAICSY